MSVNEFVEKKARKSEKIVKSSQLWTVTPWPIFFKKYLYHFNGSQVDFIFFMGKVLCLSPLRKKL